MHFSSCQHLKKRHKGHDPLHLRAGICKQILEPYATALQFFPEMHDTVTNCKRIRTNALRSVNSFFRRFVAIQNIQKRLIEMIDRCIFQLEFLRRKNNILRQPRKSLLCLFKPFVKFLARRFERFILTQLAKKLFLRILFLLVLDRLARKQASGFDQQKLCGDRQKRACTVHIKIAEIIHIRKILRRDLGHKDVFDIDLRLVDQMQQQIQRSFKFWKWYAVFFHSDLTISTKGDLQACSGSRGTVRRPGKKRTRA